MGADIHAYLDYEDEDKEARNFGRVKIGRDYWLFTLIAGVRGDSIQGMKPVSKQKGLPKKISWEVRSEAYLYIVENKESIFEHTCTREDAEKYAKYGKKYTKDKRYIEHPDWHSHTWLSFKEFEELIYRYSKLKEKKVAYAKKSAKRAPVGFTKDHIDEEETKHMTISVAYSKIEQLTISPAVAAVHGAMKALNEAGRDPKFIAWWDN